MEKKEKLKQGIYGVYLNLKTRNRKTSGIFDYSCDSRNKNKNFFIRKYTYLIKDENNDIKEYEYLENISEKDIIIFLIRTRKNKFYIDNVTLMKKHNLEHNKENIKMLNNFIWKVINSDSLDIKNPNEDYYLQQNDIIKFGNVKYIVSEIHFNNNKKDNKINNNEIISLIPKCLEYKKCDYCHKDIYRLCKCNEFHHYDCINKYIEDNMRFFQNKKKTVTNYVFRIIECKEIIKKDTSSDGIESKNYEDIKCNTYYSLKFKLSDNSIIDCYPIDKPLNKDCLILESLEFENVEYNNRIEKNIHIIELNGEEINIGREKYNDVIIDDSSVSIEHAVIRYDKINKKLLLKNKSKEAGTLVLYREPKIEMKEKEIYLQVDNTFIEAKLMKEEEYLKTKDNK